MPEESSAVGVARAGGEAAGVGGCVGDGVSRSTVYKWIRRFCEGAGWEYVHVCFDDYSRVAHAEVLPDQRQHTAVAFLRRACAWFACLGITVESTC